MGQRGSVLPCIRAMGPPIRDSVRGCGSIKEEERSVSVGISEPGTYLPKHSRNRRNIMPRLTSGLKARFHRPESRSRRMRSIAGSALTLSAIEKRWDAFDDRIASSLQ